MSIRIFDCKDYYQCPEQVLQNISNGQPTLIVRKELYGQSEIAGVVSVADFHLLFTLKELANILTSIRRIVFNKTNCLATLDVDDNSIQDHQFATFSDLHTFLLFLTAMTGEEFLVEEETVAIMKLIRKDWTGSTF